MKREAGFTLTEILVVMGIVVILISVGVPSFRYVTTANRVSGEINGLLGDMQFARSEAIREGRDVVLCQSSDGTSCTTDPTSWTSGWLVWSDLNDDGAFDPTQEILRHQTPLLSKDTLTPDATSNLTTITFNREGFASKLGGSAIMTLHDSTNNATYTRCLEITVVGSLSTTTPTSDAANCK